MVTFKTPIILSERLNPAASPTPTQKAYFSLPSCGGLTASVSFPHFSFLSDSFQQMFLRNSPHKSASATRKYVVSSCVISIIPQYKPGLRHAASSVCTHVVTRAYVWALMWLWKCVLWSVRITMISGGLCWAACSTWNRANVPIIKGTVQHKRRPSDYLKFS